ncbi:MAG TPA: hypothetical protein VH702_20750 [Vicinamibacterales bacterium]
MEISSAGPNRLRRCHRGAAADLHAVGSAEADQAYRWPLVPGRHRIVARDARGRLAETTILVK